MCSRTIFRSAACYFLGTKAQRHAWTSRLVLNPPYVALHAAVANLISSARLRAFPATKAQQLCSIDAMLQLTLILRCAHLFGLLASVAQLVLVALLATGTFKLYNQVSGLDGAARSACGLPNVYDLYESLSTASTPTAQASDCDVSLPCSTALESTTYSTQAPLFDPSLTTVTVYFTEDSVYATLTFSYGLATTRLITAPEATTVSPSSSSAGIVPRGVTDPCYSVLHAQNYSILAIHDAYSFIIFATVWYMVLVAIHTGVWRAGLHYGFRMPWTAITIILQVITVIFYFAAIGLGNGPAALKLWIPSVVIL
jgi:hypothetical protein